MNLSRELRHMLSATRNSFCGVKDILKETAFRQEVFFGGLHYLVLFFIPASFAVKLLLASLWPLIMSAELVNSAVEQVVDHISPEWNEFAKHAKDFCSAAVGMLIVLTITVWCIVLFRLVVWGKGAL